MKSSGRLKAAVFMSTGALFLSLVPVFVKLIPEETGIPVTQKLFMRGFVATVVLAGVLLVRKISFRPGNPLLLGGRALLGIGGMLTYFLAVQGMPLSEAVTINKLSPFFVLIFSWLFLKEKLTAFQVLAVALGFSGVAVILRPGTIPLTLTSGLAVVSAVFAGGAYTTLRALRKTDRPLLVVFWFSAAVTVFFFPFVLVSGVSPNLLSMLFLLFIGLSGTAGQLFMTKAYRCAPGGEVAVYGYLSVVFSMAWQIIFFDSAPSTAVMAGAALIILGGFVNYGAGGDLRSLTKLSIIN